MKPAFIPAILLMTTAANAADRPNILWITSEDNGPHLGCYGDDYADTPNLDALGARSLIYTNAWSTAPVCAPARTTIISGLYPPSTGAEHMRSMVELPARFKMYPQYLREAGYYCTNNNKEDYNLKKPDKVWDDSSRKAHWKNRAGGQPFFAIFNHTISHESKLRTRPHKQVHDPAKVRVPAYHPDTPEVRQDWAQYYDRMTEMDKLCGKNLRELKEAGLADDTIVFYYGDHGSGMPRSKRWPYNSGLHVPLLVHIPEKFKHLRPDDYKSGGKTDRLVGFIDLAPTLMSLIGVKPPEHFQGHSFCGKFVAPEQKYGFGFRGRMDERYDMLRVVRNKRYIYMRNYMPHKIYGQYIQYMFQTPTTRVWHDLHAAGKLKPPQTFFWEEKPVEELYDLQADPDEVNNLADSPEHAAIKAELRKAQQDLALRIRDLGFLPEDEVHTRSKDSTPYDIGHDKSKYDLETIMATAEKATSGKAEDMGHCIEQLTHKDSAVRYWAAMGILMRKQDAVGVSRELLHAALNDDSRSVRIIAAQALGQYGNDADVKKALPVLLDNGDIRKRGIYVAMLALNALDAMDDRAASVTDQIKALPKEPEEKIKRLGAYVPNLLKKTLDDLRNGVELRRGSVFALECMARLHFRMAKSSGSTGKCAQRKFRLRTGCTATRLRD